MADEIGCEPRDRQSTLEFLTRVIALSSAEQTEVSLHAERESLTRFAGSRIHQNVAELDCRLSVRSIEDGKTGHASTNRFDEASLRQTVEWARTVARTGRIAADPPQFAGPQTYREIHNYSAKTADVSPQERAELVKRLADQCALKGAEAAGAVSNSEHILAIANSKGLCAYHALTDSNFTATVSSDGSTGWCNSHAVDFSKLSAARMGSLALERAVLGRNPRKIPPGRYTVILEAAAVKDFLDFLAWLGFGAQAFEEGRSFMCGKLGTQITGANITITDDAYHPLGIGIPFDFEGMPRQRVALIEKGVARNVVYDRAHAARAGKDSTGHALPPKYTFGPLPMNLVLSPGEADAEEMLRSVTHGLLVSRFWYCRVVDPAKTLLTGQTRDGTFLIEDGHIVCGVRDFRFNESILESFARAEMVSHDLSRIESTLAPTLKIADFRFTEVIGESQP
ncbi:MAG: TldD/PmbA family protein [Candidatus Abyssubacteria bacterium]